jgi:hypothetical protein
MRHAVSCQWPKNGAFHHTQAVIVERARSVGLIDASPAAAVDATGLETGHVSEHSGKRRGEGLDHRQRAWPKLTVVLHIPSHLIIGAGTGIGSG